MEDTKKEPETTIVNNEIPEKDYFTKTEVENLINKKISDTFGDLIKELNSKKIEKVEEKPREKTLEEILF